MKKPQGAARLQVLRDRCDRRHRRARGLRGPRALLVDARGRGRAYDRGRCDDAPGAWRDGAFRLFSAVLLLFNLAVSRNLGIKGA